jgi:hypothetical protein
LTKEDVSLAGRRTEAITIEILGLIIAFGGGGLALVSLQIGLALLLFFSGIVIAAYGSYLYDKVKHIEWTKQALREYNDTHNKWTLQAMKEYNKENQAESTAIENPSVSNMESHEKHISSLLEKLDERLIEGKITESTYNELKREYELKLNEIKLAHMKEIKPKESDEKNEFRDRLLRVTKEMEENVPVYRVMDNMKGNVMIFDRNFLPISAMKYLEKMDPSNVKSLKVLTVHQIISDGFRESCLVFVDNMNMLKINTSIRVTDDNRVKELKDNYLIDDENAYFIPLWYKIEGTSSLLRKSHDRDSIRQKIELEWEIAKEI